MKVRFDSKEYFCGQVSTNVKMDDTNTDILYLEKDILSMLRHWKNSGKKKEILILYKKPI